MIGTRATPGSFAARFAAAGLLLAVAAGAEAATLRPHVVVHDETVRLKDIFDGAGRVGETALFRAPEPGSSVVLTGKWLRQVARAYELDWRPAPGLDESRVERSSNRVGQEQILDALRAALTGAVGPAKPFDIALDNPNPEFHLPVRMPAAVAVRQVQVDKRSGRFSATLVAPDDRPGAITMPVAGRLHELVKIPVLTRRMHAGEIIGRDDIQTQLLRAEQLGQNAVTGADQLVGKSARRALLAGKALNAADLKDPQLVSRNSMVVMTYRTANLVITAHGKARESGTAGETVRVRNANSGKTVEAIVVGPDTVMVPTLDQPPGRCATCR